MGDACCRRLFIAWLQTGRGAPKSQHDVNPCWSGEVNSCLAARNRSSDIQVQIKHIKTSVYIRRKISLMVEDHPKESHRHARTVQVPTYTGRKVAVNGEARTSPGYAKLAPVNGVPAKPGSSAKSRSRRAQSYQPTAEVILFLPEENGSNGSSAPSRHTSPGPTNGGRAATSRDSSRLGSTTNRPSSPRTGKRRPSSMHRLSLFFSRLTATKLAAKAKGDLPPIPSGKQGHNPTPLSTTHRSRTKATQRSRYSKLLPPTPTSTSGTTTVFTTSEVIVLQKDKAPRSNPRQSRRYGTEHTPRSRVLDAPELLDQASATEQDTADAAHTAPPRSTQRRSSFKSIGRKVTGKLSISRRRKNDTDGDWTSRMRLPRLAIPGHMSRCPSTGSAYSVVIQPTTPAGGRKSIWRSSKRLVELEAHVTEEEMPMRIKRILQRRGTDASEPPQVHVQESSTEGESYHTDLSLAIEVLRGEPIVEEFSMTSPVE
ncbi:hypothetical protein SCHPADRAFT_306233 [Schizopora paradoxa]|uniref:Uncharacterized protein n=1 Tax=Schizopora paradoxa TaxID=27342 RepID=A0A0H2SCF3_9AGAM|nr:hypothetical protein SCHPADRAFT_306233 [Schizopora paradoxa]